VTGPATAGEPAPSVPDWTRLDPRMLAVAPAQELVRFLPLLVAAVVAGGDRNRPWWVLGVLTIAAGTGVLRWLTTRYRVTAERVEVHSGLVFRQHRSVPRDRVRTVDVTSNPLHRLFRLAVVRVGTGRQEQTKQEELALNAVATLEAERIRGQLLDRSSSALAAELPAAPAADAAGTAGAPGVVLGRAGAPETLAQFSWSWLRFAPLTVFGIVAVGTLIGGAWQLLDQFGAAPEDLRLVQDLAGWLANTPILLAITMPAAALVVIGALGSVVLYIEAWWRYELARHPDGTLQVNRGLLTKRSMSLEERRLRGVAVLEPLLLRAGRGARCDAVATGTKSAGLLPPAPRAEAHRVATLVLREPTSPTLTPLHRHPAAALRRRLIRAVLPAAAVVVALAIADLWLPSWPWALAVLVLLPASVLIAIDRYHNLGHTNTPRQLISREGSLVRQTVALHHQGIIGWRISQSIFQRRAGLATVAATTAAGAGAYRVLDVELPTGLLVAEAATPGLLTPFLTPAVGAPASTANRP
jgi:putative membrane protein